MFQASEQVGDVFFQDMSFDNFDNLPAIEVELEDHKESQ